MERINAWTQYTEADIQQLEATAADYRAFLDSGKTERECVKEAIRRAEAKGFQELKKTERLLPGDKVYVNCMGKALLLFIAGKEPLENGMNIVGAHIDSPRLDLKQNPLYEEGDLAYLDTHYYGGIKKYQWLVLPLALHGVVAKKDGSVIELAIGEKEEDPVFCVSDILPHLGAGQMEKNAAQFVPGESLNVLVGGRPLKGEEKEPVKQTVLRYLKETYGMEEEDFLSAEIEVVPAGRCRELGFDRSMLLGYGHDDRVCGYASLKAILDIEDIPATTVCCVLADKEEIGSVGATGMQARFFENAVAELMLRLGQYSEIALRRALAACRMLSCDVSAGFDPEFADCFETKNTAYLGRGVCFNKYTGARGKSGSNDANAEYIGKLRRLMDDNQVFFQTAELGKVDRGGGGTIAYICALYGMEVIDSGVPVLAMHAPWEIISKADLYESVKAYTVFMKLA